MEKIGIKKTWFIISIVALVFNLFAAGKVAGNKVTGSGFMDFVNLTFPFWAALAVGSILGYIIAIFPYKEQPYPVRLLRGKFLGIMSVNFILVLFYIYSLYVLKLTGN